MASAPGTTARIRRRNEPKAVSPSAFKFEPRAIIPAPPPLPGKPPGPFGDLTAATAGEIGEVATAAWRQVRASSAYDWTRGTKMLLGYLSEFGGATWQERWQASGLDQPACPVAGLGIGNHPERARTVSRGLRSLLCLRVVRPSLAAFRSNRLNAYAEAFRAIQRDPLLDGFFTFTDASGEGWLHRQAAKFDAAVALTVFGITLEGLTPEALLHYGMEGRRLGTALGTHSAIDGQLAGRQAWHFLHQMGHFPASVPAEMRWAAIRGQRTVAEIVDACGVRNAEVRDLLVDYVTQRSAELDYSYTDQLARTLAGLFWATIEKINPQQADLRLSEETYQQWKAAIAVLPDGRPRARPEAIQVTVRSFYLDLQTWAVSDPARWARWAAPSPVRDAEIRLLAARQRRGSERMADRTRQRQPLLPLLLDHVTAQHEDLRALLAAAAATAPGAGLSHGGRAYRRTATGYDQRKDRREGAFPVRVTDLAAGRTFNVAAEEDRAFWEWAIISTLRHTGLRAEELCELTHLSVRQYQRPNGEVVALLVVAPSKTDRERVIPIQAELFAVIAAIIRRHLRDQPAISMVRRYDHHERTWSEPMPFLFQRRSGPKRAVLSYQTMWRMIRRPCQALANTRPEFAGLNFASHDFRRLLSA